jgi:hypothetical protein
MTEAGKPRRDRRCTAVNYLERYRAGECEQVWAELLSLGADTRAEPLYSEAYAIAHEAMGRVKQNLDLLIPRLRAIGYEFGQGFLAGLDEATAAVLAREAPVFARPSSNVGSRIIELEGMVGTLPLSLCAFYEEVGSVNLVGELPRWMRLRPWGTGDQLHFIKAHPDFDWSNYSLDRGLDPLFVHSIDVVIGTLHQHRAMAERLGEATLPTTIDIAPDYNFKYGMGGSAPYSIEPPCLAIDAPLQEEWHNTTFVNYLRICFRWGGMPGLERCAHPPMDDIAYLTEGMLAF